MSTLPGRRTRLIHHLEVSLKLVGGRDQGVSDMTREMIPTHCGGAGFLEMQSQERVGFLLNAALREERAKAERRCGERKSKRVLAWLLCSAACLPAQAQTPVINLNGFVNAATGRNASSIPVTARGTIVSIYGNNLAGVPLTANGFPLPRDLGGVHVMFGSIPAPLLFVSPNQINAQVPFELPDVSSVDLVVQNGNENSAACK
jgi:IPT/TIG domain